MTTTVTVPNRTFMVNSDGSTTGVFRSMDLWAWPGMINILQPRLVWSFLNDAEVFEQLEMTDEQVQAIFIGKANNNDLQGFDLLWVLDLTSDLWCYWTRDLTQLKTRLLELCEYIWSSKDEEHITRLIQPTWDIIKPVNAFIPDTGNRFWQTMYKLWDYRFKEDQGKLVRLDFGTPTDDIIRRFMKLDIANA